MRETIHKYVVDPELLRAAALPEQGILINQVYLTPCAPGPEVRVSTYRKHRDGLVNGSINVKFSGGYGYDRAEFETPIPSYEAEAMIERIVIENKDRRANCLPTQSLIQKTRITQTCADFIIDIDIYAEANAGLVIAEIQMNAEQYQRCNTDAAPLPEYIRGEITGGAIYTGRALAQNPYREWYISNKELHVRNLRARGNTMPIKGVNHA